MAAPRALTHPIPALRHLAEGGDSHRSGKANKGLSHSVPEGGGSSTRRPSALGRSSAPGHLYTAPGSQAAPPSCSISEQPLAHPEPPLPDWLLGDKPGSDWLLSSSSPSHLLPPSPATHHPGGSQPLCAADSCSCTGTRVGGGGRGGQELWPCTHKGLSQTCMPNQDRVGHTGRQSPRFITCTKSKEMSKPSMLGTRPPSPAPSQEDSGHSSLRKAGAVPASKGASASGSWLLSHLPPTLHVCHPGLSEMSKAGCVAEGAGEALKRKGQGAACA